MIHIVVLGGGYGGLEVVKRLLTKKSKAPFCMTLIDRQPFHTIKTENYALAAGTLADYQTRVSFPKHPLLDLIYDEVKQINLKQQWVETSNQRISFDYLVIALGSEDRFDLVKGARDYARSIQTIEETRRTSVALLNTKPYGTVKIVGGGLTGVELASELRESREDLNIHIYEKGNQVLKTLPKKIQNYASDWLKRHDIEVLTHSNIEFIGKHNVYRNGLREEADLILWAAGIQSNAVVRGLMEEKDQMGRLKIDSLNRVQNYPNIFAIGDCSSTPFPPSAQIAQQQGSQVAIILHHLINRKKPIRIKPIKNKGVLGTLGKKDGFGMVSGVELTGKLPRILKRGVEWQHINR
ncbi:FAD-dependent oxidoreductase [Pullulanibacillus sp. KACC 23026]|uniref:NAD(P)/FAD-dependent oxidoreductase n=1 Tax=Pullulanibacillus sp. KACC 23026 TaxID=3028315 RepID=UPI0023AEDD10|nr:FAD-dependent oxidoreductase [Pullulanibacillus sp. KACC 23026]WEG11007.1 FAD-dependent oxidoreductase [Pullulanibacillus sp. KACC 23026]